MQPNRIRILAIGDIMGRAGRDCLTACLAEAKQEFTPDVIVANGENAAGGFGITEKIFLEFRDIHGIHAVTTGNHWADKKEIYGFKKNYGELVVPANMFNVDSLQEGFVVREWVPGCKIAVINLTGRVFMQGQNRCPFMAIDNILRQLPADVKVKIVDFHGEASSEKQAFAQYVLGRVSLVYGTHTHCPTADERILGGQTGYLTDLGMTGAYDSVIGIETAHSLARFLGKGDGGKTRFEPATRDPWFCFVVADVDSRTGHCQNISRHRWKLSEFRERKPTCL
jgi:metallophosphoesterase (TIGR00282 family)